MLGNLADQFDALLYCPEICQSIAISDGRESGVSFGQLAKRAAFLASYLREQHIGYGDVIAIASTKVVDDYALMLACVYEGIIYTHIDFDNPKDRLNAILSQCEVKLIFSETLTQTKFEESLFCPVVSYQQVDLWVSRSASKSAESLDVFTLINRHIDGDSIAYIMFTSGSTGVPKGVAVTHQNLLHFSAWVKGRYQITCDDNFAQISPLYFDNSVFDIYGGLFNGACLTPITKPLLSQPLALVDTIDRAQCSIWFSVPSLLIYLQMMRVLRAGVFGSIRVFTFGGEGFAKSELKKLYDLYHHHAQFINVYGPTECTCICSSHTINDEDFADVNGLPSLGELNTNFSALVVDENGHPCDEGELWLLGPLVAKGYYNDAERTDRVFEQFSGLGHYQKSLYKTGDKVRRVGNQFSFVGRLDNQIKHQGYRIELEEIEIGLANIEQVAQVLVVYHRVNAAFGKLVAFIILADDSSIDAALLQVKANELLPSYMVPSRFEFVGEFPKNANGKACRKQLLARL